MPLPKSSSPQQPSLTNRLSMETSPGAGPFNPVVAQGWRGNLPSYGNTVLHHISAEPVTVNLHLVGMGTLAAGGSQSLVSGAGFTQTNNISLAASDTGQITFNNVSIQVTTTDSTNFPIGGLLVGHPTITVAGSPGTPPNGVLNPGQSYSSLGLQVSVVIQNVGANAIVRADGVYNVVLTLTVNVHGSVTNH